MRHRIQDECEHSRVGPAHTQRSPDGGPPRRVRRSEERALSYDAEQLNFGGMAEVTSKPNHLVETRIRSNVCPLAFSCGSGLCKCSLRSDTTEVRSRSWESTARLAEVPGT
jgi:hypothetical protein